MCVINNGGKNINPMSWEEIVAYGLRNSPKVEIAHVENDVSTIVDHEVQLKYHQK